MVENPAARIILFAVTAALVLGCPPPPPSDDEDPGLNGAMAEPPVEVKVTFTKTDEGCEVTYDPHEYIILHKDWRNGAHQAIWTWEGDYDRAWVIVPAGGLRKCLNTNTVDTNERGFEIIRDGTTKTVNPAPDCPTAEYKYNLRAVTAEGDRCSLDPKVRIED